MYMFRTLLILMFLTSTALADKYENIPYLSPGSVDAVLDVHVPSSGVEVGVPTILFIHGGGWYSGDKSDSPELWMPLIVEGYNVIACNYTLSSAVSPSYPQAVHDVKAVVRWIRSNGVDEYGLSPTIAVMGPSAGGHLTEMLATTDGVEIFEPLPAPDKGYAVQASMPFFGLCDFVLQVKSGGNTYPFREFLGGPLNEKTRPTYIEASPITWISSDDAPMFHVHGFDDPIHFYEQAVVMNEALNDIEVYSSMHIYEGGHAFADIGYKDFMGYEAASAILLDQIPILLSASRDGDINYNGSIEVEDLLAVISSWGDCPDLPIDCPADIDGSGVVDVTDLLIVVGNWGPCE